MAASKNNQFWKLRSKHGRDTLFSSPEFLWSAACEYFDWCDENPWYLYIEGKIRYRQYETKQGEKRYVTEIHADKVEFFSFGSKREDNQRQNTTSQPAQPEPTKEDLPF